MPNRIIKQSAFESEKISALSDFDFRLWVGLITQADDAGRGDARPAILKGHIFPLRERVTAKDIEAALLRLAAGSCISLYNVGGKSYYQFPNWAKHQRVYNAKAKTPAPEEADENDNLRESAASCGELPQAAANRRLNPNPNINPNPNPNPKESTRTRAFTPPSVEDVAAYVTEKGYGIDPEAFVAYYTAKGWKVGSSPMKDWKAAVVTWVKRDRESGRKSAVPAGVSKKAAQRNAECQSHNVISPGMMEAARKMLEEDV